MRSLTRVLAAALLCAASVPLLALAGPAPATTGPNQQWALRV